MTKRWQVILLCPILLFLPLGLRAKETPQPSVTNSLYFGVNLFPLYLSRGFAGGGYIGLQTQFDNPYVALLNTVGFHTQNMPGYADSTVPYPSYNLYSIYYTPGIRVFFGIPYVFFDLNVGFTYTYSTHNHEGWIMPTISAFLGFNIPFTQKIYMQLSVGGGFQLVGDFTTRFSLQFEL